MCAELQNVSITTENEKLYHNIKGGILEYNKKLALVILQFLIANATGTLVAVFLLTFRTFINFSEEFYTNLQL